MSESLLQVAISQHSQAGHKDVNQDFFGVNVPSSRLQRKNKGIAIAIADGISSSQVSQVASETAVTSFLQDYYATSEAWSVKTSAFKVIQAINGWLFAQTKQSQYRFDKEKGYVCTFSAVVLKSRQAHIFHSGDSRIYRLYRSEGVDNALTQEGSPRDQLECLTQDHVYATSETSHYLTKALGIHTHIDLDYHSLEVSEGDVFILATDGVYDYIEETQLIDVIRTSEIPWEKKAEHLTQLALTAKSPDNLTIQLIRVETLPMQLLTEWQLEMEKRRPMPPLQEGMIIEGYQIIRALHRSSRSQVFLAVEHNGDELTSEAPSIPVGSKVVIKVPSTEMSTQSDHLQGMLMEEWVARRIDNAHVIKAARPYRPRRYLYTVMAFLPGKTLAQWLLDNPKPTLEVVREIIGQVAKGLQAMHRQEMVHQDLRPHNVMINAHNQVTLIDLGATRIAGVSEIAPVNTGILGTAQYVAPEYFMGELGSTRSDIFSLGVIAYQMLSGGELPYGNHIARSRSRRDLKRLRYQSIKQQSFKRRSINTSPTDKSSFTAATWEVPDWVDFAVAKATRVQPLQRYAEVSEFIADLQRPSSDFLRYSQPPLVERDPVRFWQCIALILLVLLLYQWVPEGAL